MTASNDIVRVGVLGAGAWGTALALVAGLVLGCWNAWHWVAREQSEMHEEESDDE